MDSLSFFYGDVSSREDNIKAVKLAIDSYGGLDIICANAGIFPLTWIKDISEKELETCKTYLSENTTGLHYFLAKAILFEDWYNRWSDDMEKSEAKVDSEIKKSLSDMRDELHRIVHHMEDGSVMDSIFESGKWESLYTVEGNNPVHSKL